MEELRKYAIEKFKDGDHEYQRLENHVTTKLSDIDKALDPLKPHVKDLSVLEKVRHLVSANEVKDAIDDRVKAVDHQLEELRAASLTSRC